MRKTRRKADEPRDNRQVRVPDRTLATGSDWERTLVERLPVRRDTIRDITRWADNYDPRGRSEIGIDLVGTSGPCEACQIRLRNMVDDVLDRWSRKYRVPKADLPQVRITSYYGNNPNRPFPRGEYVTYNGWPTDQPREDMGTVRAGRRLIVREHAMPS